MRNIIKGIAFIAIFSIAFGCSDYLDVVPDNVATIDDAFKNRTNAEKYLFTCYNMLPNTAHPHTCPGFMGGDEIWAYAKSTAMIGEFGGNIDSWEIALGTQNSNDPYLNFWDGRRSGKDLFIGIRDCNIFLENIEKPRDIPEFERMRWIAEAKFLKAYYHFYLMRHYGAIPIIEENIPVGASPDQVKIYREPFDEGVDYIVKLIDEAIPDLPVTITAGTTENGRISQVIAHTVKAQCLLNAASPLFNGNADLASLVDNRGKQLFPQEYDASKWTKAADAAKVAIDLAEANGFELYESNEANVTDSTRLTVTIRNSVMENFNDEIIWGNLDNNNFLTHLAQPKFLAIHLGGNNAKMMLAPPLRMAEQFYTKNGVPIDEDISWEYSERYELREAEADHRYYIKEGRQTAKLHFDREARFYASVGFGGSTWFGNGVKDEDDLYVQQELYEEITGGDGYHHSATGYLAKKLVAVETVLDKNNAMTIARSSFPRIRLADLYLMYTEALNESLAAPNAEVYKYIDKVRERAGLGTVVESWANHSSNSSKPSTKEGMREIVHQERLIELAFEGKRFYDLRRWKMADQYLNNPIQGWTITGGTPEDYYKPRILYVQEFRQRDYLWPIKLSTLSVNSNLVQNPGW